MRTKIKKFLNISHGISVVILFSFSLIYFKRIPFISSNAYNNILNFINKYHAYFFITISAIILILMVSYVVPLFFKDEKAINNYIDLLKETENIRKSMEKNYYILSERFVKVENDLNLEMKVRPILFEKHTDKMELYKNKLQITYERLTVKFLRSTHSVHQVAKQAIPEVLQENLIFKEWEKLH